MGFIEISNPDEIAAGIPFHKIRGMESRNPLLHYAITTSWELLDAEAVLLRILFVRSPALQGVFVPDEDALKGWTTYEDFKP